MVGVDALREYALAFVVITLTIAVGAMILGEMQDSETNTTAVPWQSMERGLEGLEELASWLPTIALVVAAAVILTLIILAFAYGKDRGGGY